MKKLSLIAVFSIVLSGCFGGNAYKVDQDNGYYYRVTDIGHTNVARRGSQLAVFELCSPDGVCTEMGREIVHNPTLLEQLAGPGAAVGSAELIRKGLKDSGDTINNSTNNNVGVNTKVKTKVNSFHCQGNCD